MNLLELMMSFQDFLVASKDLKDITRADAINWLNSVGVDPVLIEAISACFNDDGSHKTTDERDCPIFMARVTPLFRLRAKNAGIEIH